MTDMSHQVKLRAALDYLKDRNLYALALNSQFVYRNHAETDVSARRWDNVLAGARTSCSKPTKEERK
jgi:hypothetical protein